MNASIHDSQTISEQHVTTTMRSVLSWAFGFVTEFARGFTTSRRGRNRLGILVAIIAVRWYAAFRM